MSALIEVTQQGSAAIVGRNGSRASNRLYRQTHLASGAGARNAYARTVCAVELELRGHHEHEMDCQ